MGVGVGVLWGVSVLVRTGQVSWIKVKLKG